MRNEAFSPNPMRLNVIAEEIPAVGPASRRGALSTYPQNPQRERKKEAKKERESTAATIFVSKTGNYNRRWREIIIDARQAGMLMTRSPERFPKTEANFRKRSGDRVISIPA